MKYRVLFSIAGNAIGLFFVVLLLFACVKNERQKNERAPRVDVSSIKPLELKNPYKIVTTTGFVYDIVSHVVGDRADVVQIMPTGVDPHTYIPTRSDIVDVYYADVVIYSGIHLEGGMYNVFNRIKDKRILYAVADTVKHPSIAVEDVDDPHIWMDVQLWIQGTQGVADILSALDTPFRSEYQHNASMYVQQLLDLDEKLRVLFDTIPKEKRILITSHDAFNYFDLAYDFKVYGIQGISTVAESSLKHIANLIDIIVEHGVDAVFVESTISPKYVHALIEGAASKGVEVKEGGQLYADSLGEKGSGQDNYIDMMLFNGKTITMALGGNIEVLNVREGKK